MHKEKWTKKEDEICCKIVIDIYVIEKKNTSVADCVKCIRSCEGIKYEENSVKMRMQNIKALLEDMGISNTLDVSPLAHAGKQTLACLIAYLNECGIIH